MKKFLIRASVLLTAILFSFLPVAASAQTVTLNDGAILQSNTNRVGVNIGAIDYWDNGQILKNLIGSSNPGFEPLQNRQIWAVGALGTTTSFVIPDIYDGVPPNYWVGGTFTVVESQVGGAELGCTGTVASNTGPNYPVNGVLVWVAPVITMSAPCAAPFQAGDIVIMNKTTFPTPESWWEGGGLGGTAGTASKGGQLLSDTTDLCATCGTQALTLNASVKGSLASASSYFDSEFADNVFVLMNGTYQVSFWAKIAAGTPTMVVSASRGTKGGFNCGSYTPSLTTTWAKYTWTCTASESASNLTPAAAQVVFSNTGGSIYLDNVAFQKISSNPNNTTVLRDEVIQTLQNFYGPSVGNNPGTLRYWVNQNGETTTNWTQPDYAHSPTSGGTGYFTGPGGAGAENLSLEDYLVICQYLNASPYLEIPVTLTTTDAANLIEFLAGPSSSTFGNRRAGLGQIQPWTSVFSTIHLSFCNECWNGQSFGGQSLAERLTAPNLEYYYDYSVRARDVFAAMRADSYYTPSAFDLVMNAQTAVNYTADIAIQRAHPDSVELEDYAYGPVNSFATDAAMWGPAMVDPYEKVTNPTDIRNFYQSVHDYQGLQACGPTGTANCSVNIYEWGQGTIGGGLDQAHLDVINAGAGQGVVMALQPLLNLQYYGIRPQSFFSLAEYKNSALNGNTAKLWGNVIDMGGATNNVRPTFLGVELINQSIIGPMYACPINNNVTYNFAGSSNGVLPMPAMTNVPYLYAFCFENGTKRSLVLINTDLTASHTITFGGINPPVGTVTQRQLAPDTLDQMNEANTGKQTNLTTATTAIETTTLSNPASISLPPFSATALDYTAAAPAAAAMPIFTPVAGIYTTAQAVVISDQSAATTIYYTTDGSSPTTSSKLYTGPVTVSTGETLQALAVGPGYTNSPPASASYLIYPVLPVPTFGVPTGTYSTTQTVAIGEATAGTTVYYTTDGSTPTTSSAIYAGPISVSTTKTIQAIAVGAGYTNSPLSGVTITIAPQIPTPTFSSQTGTYLSAIALTMNDTQSGAIVYYTTDGSTPTAASMQYRGALWISATKTTFNAIAIQAGYTTSQVATSVITIAPVLPSPSFLPSTGIYTTVQSVSINDIVAGTSFYYTTDGSTPTTSSAKYTGPISVGKSQTIQAIGVATNYTNSAVVASPYTINLIGSGTSGAPPVTTLPAPAFSLAGGTYPTTQTVTLSDATPGTTIYYTTTGIAPTTASAIYTGALTVSASETLEALAVETGYNNSPVTTVAYYIGGAVPQYINYASNGFSTSSMSLNYGATISGGALQLTDGGTGEIRSGWYKTKVPVSAFTTNFTFQMLNASADGITFTIQNDPKGMWALGSGGGGLAYFGMQKSVAVKFDIYNDAGEGSDSTGIYTNGASPTLPSTDLTFSGVTLKSGDLMHATLVYNGTTLTLTLTDTKTGIGVTKSFTVNIPSIVGASTAYVGFTGSTGNNTAIQQVTSWTYTTP